MISIVICSQHPKMNDALSQNIQETIGVDYELIHIDNSGNQYNVFEAYNKGVEQAKGQILCFMHEDVLFRSQNWGRAVEQHLSQDFVGALGVAGGCVVTKQLDWRFYGFGCVYLIQGTRTVGEQPHYYVHYEPSDKVAVPLRQVATLDGVWMCMRKELFETIRFDDVNYHDFHLYDTDICMQINKLNKGLFVTSDVLLEHMSEGTFTKGFSKSLEIFFRKWAQDLPMVRGMMVSQDDIDHALAKARQLYDERIAKDAIVITLRQLFAQKNSGQACREYTEEEKALMDESLFMFCRKCIKDKRMKRKEVKPLVDEYLTSPIARRKLALFWKYLWYRYVRI